MTDARILYDITTIYFYNILFFSTLKGFKSNFLNPNWHYRHAKYPLLSSPH